MQKTDTDRGSRGGCGLGGTAALGLAAAGVFGAGASGAGVCDRRSGFGEGVSAAG